MFAKKKMVFMRKILKLTCKNVNWQLACHNCQFDRGQGQLTSRIGHLNQVERQLARHIGNLFCHAILAIGFVMPVLKASLLPKQNP